MAQYVIKGNMNGKFLHVERNSDGTLRQHFRWVAEPTLATVFESVTEMVNLVSRFRSDELGPTTTFTFIMDLTKV